MSRPGAHARASGVAARLGAFVAERHPLALPFALEAFDAVGGHTLKPRDHAALDALRTPFQRDLARRLYESVRAPEGLAETTPGVGAAKRLEQARAEVVAACDGLLRREALAASLTRDERREALRGMCLTRAVDARLKQLFLSGEVRWRDRAFQGKGFRSLGQEAIYAAALRLRRGPRYATPDGQWTGDVVAPIIRDLGFLLAMRQDEEAIALVLGAQMGKAGAPLFGRDLHPGHPAWGVMPPAAPLTVGALTMTGMALGFSRDGSGRVAVAIIGDGGSSLGEWHEAVNLAATRRLPAIFCVQNNQTALSTPLADNTAARVFADKAAGYGIPGVTVDGTDPEAIFAAFTWAAERARAGDGPTLVETVSMRMCGHAHHDDMLYLGRDTAGGWDYPAVHDGGYVNRPLYEFWSKRDPIPTYAARLEAEGVIAQGELDAWKRDAEALVERVARTVIDAPWPDGASAAVGVLQGEAPRVRVEVLAPAARLAAPLTAALPPLAPALPVDAQGHTFLEGVMLGIRDALRADPRVFVFGEDVGGAYGNAFLLLRPLLEEFGDRLLNAPIAEAAILGASVGAALAGQRPIAEMQFNDFVASGFNQLVNNAAKVRYRWGGDVPMVVRMPWGGLRYAGPYHSQNTEAWFYRTPGLKIVVPSTPEDARALMAAAVADPDPVLYYEHIALYRDPRIKQRLPEAAPAPLPAGRAALRRAGRDLAIVTYGAYVHHALRVAGTLAAEGIEAAVLDLRWLAPLDREAVLAVTRHCHRLLVVHEDTRTGGIGESLAAIVQEEAFEALDAPIRILGALDTPIPYSPPLEEHVLVSEGEIETAARLLVAY